jgi:hypothetical protein
MTKLDPDALKKRTNFTLWVTKAESKRIRAAVAGASVRLGLPITVSIWLHGQIMRAVADEEAMGSKRKPR